MKSRLDFHKEKIREVIELARFEGYIDTDIVQILVEILNEK